MCSLYTNGSKSFIIQARSQGGGSGGSNEPPPPPPPKRVKVRLCGAGLGLRSFWGLAPDPNGLPPPPPPTCRNGPEANCPPPPPTFRNGPEVNRQLEIMEEEGMIKQHTQHPMRGNDGCASMNVSAVQ